MRNLPLNVGSGCAAPPMLGKRPRLELAPVDNVLVSCHSIVQGQSLVQTFFEGASKYVEWTKWVFGVQSDEATDENAVDLSPAVDFLVSVLDLVIPKELLMK